MHPGIDIQVDTSGGMQKKNPDMTLYVVVILGHRDPPSFHNCYFDREAADLISPERRFKISGSDPAEC